MRRLCHFVRLCALWAGCVDFVEVTAAKQPSLLEEPPPTRACFTSALPTSLAIAVLVVDADEGAAEGEYFAKGDEDGVMDLCQWWAEEARYEQCAPKRAHCNSGDELEVLHGLGFYFLLITLICTDVSRIRVDQ